MSTNGQHPPGQVETAFDGLSLDPFTSPHVWTRYAVELEGERPIVGGVPLNPEIAAAWLAVKAGDPDLIEQAVEDLTGDRPPEEREKKIEEAKQDELAKITTGFRRDTTGLFLRAYPINAMLREAASAAGLTTALRGLRQVIQHALFVVGEGPDEDRVYVRGADGEPMKEPTATEESVVHAMTPQGKIAAIKRFETVYPWRARFLVDVLDPRLYLPGVAPKAEAREKLDRDVLAVMLEVGSRNGLGANRTAYYGRFRVAGWKRLTETPAARVGEAMERRRRPAPKARTENAAE